MNDDVKSSLTVGLILACFIAPFAFDRANDCYVQQSDCEKDWNAGDCKTNPQQNPPNQCHYLGRSHYYYFRRSPYGGNHSTYTVSRGGFGSIGRGFSSGS